MIGRLRAAFAQAPWLMTGFVLALALTLFFGTRMILGAIYWSDPRHSDQPIAGWMTPRYVALSWRVPPDVIIRALALERPEGRLPRLEEIAMDRGTDLATLAAQIEAAILAHRAAAE